MEPVKEPEWMQKARQVPLRTPPDTRAHDSRLRFGQAKNRTPR